MVEQAHKDASLLQELQHLTLVLQDFFHINSSTGHISMTGSVSGSAFDFDTGNAISGSVTASTVFWYTRSERLFVGIAINNAQLII